MGTLLKYLFYILIIAAIYFIGVGFYQGTLNKNSTLGEMTEHVTSNTGDIIRSGYDTTKDAVQGGLERLKENGAEALENGQEAIDVEVKNVTE